MKEFKYKKIKLSPHTRDRIYLFARDYDRDLYVENDIWNPSIFEDKAYPESTEKYFYFKFNQDVYNKNNNKNNAQEAREKEIARLEAEEEKRRADEKFIAEQLALQKAQEMQQAQEKQKARPAPPRPAKIEEKKQKITKLNIGKRDKANPIEELFFQALKEDGFKK